jgi:hypothetical protein
MMRWRVQISKVAIMYLMWVANIFLGLHSSLVESSKARRARLEDARNFFQFLQDHEEEESWLVEKQRICKAGISAKDLRAVLSLQQKHKVSAGHCVSWKHSLVFYFEEHLLQTDEAWFSLSLDSHAMIVS